MLFPGLRVQPPVKSETRKLKFIRRPSIAVVGNKAGLKSRQLRSLERLSQKKVSPDEIISRELARSLAAQSTELNRQLALLIHRSGKVETVIVGDFNRIVIPALTSIRTAGGRLRGLRCVHTVLSGSAVSEEDIMDMACLRLDLMSVLTLKDGLPEYLHTAHLVPGEKEGRVWTELDPCASGSRNSSPVSS